MEAATPVSNAYWVDPGRLLAGEYPGGRDAAETGERLASFAAAGVGLFVDLTEEGELRPYAHLLDGARHVRVPIRDMETTTAAGYRAALDAVDAGLAERRTVYVHCQGGLGRTGTIVGCWLTRHGVDEGDALARLAFLRRGAATAALASPETEAQRRIVRDWRRGG